MKYLDIEAMRALDGRAFRDQKPYPWVNPQGLLTDDGWRSLVTNLPDLALFDNFRGLERKYGQGSHDRFGLEYEDGLDLPVPWQEFIAELCSDPYRQFLAGLFGRGDFGFRFHWHFAPSGAEVSPHCDSQVKLGSQIFYLNTDDDWRPEWGGETVILDDGGRMSPGSSPNFEDFDASWDAEITENRSVIFGRKENSWHGVREIRCPEGALRKVFIVVFEDTRVGRRIRKNASRLLKGKPMVPLRDPALY